MKMSRFDSMTTPNALVQRLWNYCNILRDDGLSYGDYVEQLTFLLFLKIADEQAKEPYVKGAEPSRLCSEETNQRLDAAATVAQVHDLAEPACQSRRRFRRGRR